MGGLQIHDPKDKASAMQLNIVQKLYKKMIHPTHPSPTTYARLLDQTLAFVLCPSLIRHIELMGPTEWRYTANRLQGKDLIMKQMFRSMAQYLEDMETDSEAWSYAPILGHTAQSPIYRIGYEETLQLQGITVSYLFSKSASRSLIQTFNQSILCGVDNELLKNKLIYLFNRLKQNVQQGAMIGHVTRTLLHCTLTTEGNISQKYMKHKRH